MSNDMLCGDEVSSIVVDLGGSFCKFGAGGQDSPRHVFSSEVGNFESANESKLVVGDMGLRLPRNNININPTFTEEGINWNHVEKLFEYGIKECMQIDPSTYPIICSESYFTTNRQKEKLFELFYENFNAPAAYMAHGGVLSSISAGRPTSLVVDFGARQTRIIPVVDGYVLNRAIVKTARGGDWIDKKIGDVLSAGGHSIQPWFDYSGRKLNAALVSSSFREFHYKNILSDIKGYFCSVPTDVITDFNREDQLRIPLSIPSYELPDGTVIEPSENLCCLPGQLFVPSSRPKNRLEIQNHYLLPAHMQQLDIDPEIDSIPELVYASVAKCDVDVRRDLLQNILVVGGGSLLQGISQRLCHELTEILPGSIKVKVNSMLPTERRFSSWIGGSILSICGTFQQKWISREQYNEQGIRMLMD